eukprot:Gb_11441 [translate_table: standard]
MKLRLFILSALMCTLLERLPCLGEGVVTMEKTFAMVKPDGMMGNHSEEIKRIILATGFVIATEKIVQLDEAAVRIFYAEHSQREFFPSLTRFMTSSCFHLATQRERNHGKTSTRSLKLRLVTEYVRLLHWVYLVLYVELARHHVSNGIFRLIDFSSGPVLAMVLEKEDAVAQWRSLIGPTDARKARVSHPKRCNDVITC